MKGRRISFHPVTSSCLADRWRRRQNRTPSPTIASSSFKISNLTPTSIRNCMISWTSSKVRWMRWKPIWTEREKRKRSILKIKSKSGRKFYKKISVRNSKRNQMPWRKLLVRFRMRKSLSLWLLILTPRDIMFTMFHKLWEHTNRKTL